MNLKLCLAAVTDLIVDIVECRNLTINTHGRLFPLPYQVLLRTCNEQCTVTFVSIPAVPWMYLVECARRETNLICI
ncbi:hypothetical protein F4823DRAFT_583513 [Ustulina deusta]|nr:hypothetical protein F4823DRAFT_583513 [Ustulina deusta]